MGDVSEHFSRKEFECHCNADCGFAAVDTRLLEVAEAIRNHYNKPVHVHCVCRCLDHNRAVGSKDTSQHVRGLAMDFHITGEDPNEIAHWIDENLLNGTGGVGVYDWGVHVDVRNRIARWDNRSELV